MAVSRFSLQDLSVDVGLGFKIKSKKLLPSQKNIMGFFLLPQDQNLPKFFLRSLTLVLAILIRKVS